MKIKDMPCRVDGQPAVKAVWLGWERVGSLPGYRAFVVTVDEATLDKTPTFTAHLLGAEQIDSRWVSIGRHGDLNKEQADGVFHIYEQKS